MTANGTMRDEGYIKFSLRHRQGAPPEHPLLPQLDALRQRLYVAGVIGAYPDGIGYGNVSIRLPGANRFIITGTATGNKAELQRSDYCRVISFDIDNNSVVCEGEIRASSESMTHGALYRSCPQVNCVLHIHDQLIWEKMLDCGAPATPAAAAFGTPQMAHAVGRIAKRNYERGALVMTGHQEGVIAWGESIAAAEQQIRLLLADYR